MNAENRRIAEDSVTLTCARERRGRLNGRIAIIEFAKQQKKTACGKQRPHAIPDGGQHDRAGPRLQLAHDTDDRLEAVASDMSDLGKIEHQVSCAIIQSRFHQFDQLGGLCLVDVAARAKHSDSSVVFERDRHGYIVLLAPVGCRGVSIKVHSDSI